VYSPALLALKRRRTEIERYLAEEAQKRRQALTAAPQVSVSLYTECSKLHSHGHFQPYTASTTVEHSKFKQTFLVSAGAVKP
jgi:hypothetical protein